jgi:hypothetical protein
LQAPTDLDRGFLRASTHRPYITCRRRDAGEADAERVGSSLDVFPIHFAPAHLFDLHPLRLWVMIVEDDERFAHRQTVEGGEDERVPL